MRRGLVLAIAIVLVGGGAGSAPGVVSSAAMLDLDVIFVATDLEVVYAMLEAAKVGPGDVGVDLTTTGEPAKRRPWRPAKAAAHLAKVKQDVAAARQEHHHLAGQREQVTQSIRTLGHAYHLVDWERGVRRNGTRIAGDIQDQIATIRILAQQECLSQAC